MIYDYDQTLENISYFLETVAEWINFGPFHVDENLNLIRDGYVGKYSDSIIYPPNGRQTNNALISKIMRYDEQQSSMNY